jgi:hypothetical protein
MPVMHNVDRSGDTLLPRGGEVKINTAACPGTILGMLATTGFDGDLRYLAATHPEIVLVACKSGAAGYTTTKTDIGFIVPTETDGPFHVMFSIAGQGTCRFLDLGTHILVYNGTSELLICKRLQIPSANFAVASNGTVTVTGTPFVNISGAWDVHGGKFTFKISDVWYGPYPIYSVSDDGLTFYLYDHTQATSYTGASGTTTASQVMVTSAVYVNDTSTEDVPPTPVIELIGTGSLTGSYQWCFTYETYDGFETNPGAWTAITALAAQNALVKGFKPAAYSMHTVSWFAKMHLYRRGGANGDNALRVMTLVNEAATLGTKTYLVTLSQAENGAAVTTINTNGVITGWPDIGVVTNRIAAEDFRYTSHATTIFTGGAQAITSWGDDAPVYLSSYLDSNLDSALVGPTLRTDHGPWPAYQTCATIKSAEVTGDRLHLAFSSSFAGTYATTPLPDERVYMSSIESWRYFNDKSAIEVAALSDDYTGGFRDIGSDGSAILKLKTGPSGELIIFKRRGIYALSGRALWAMKVQLLSGLPTTDAPDSVAAGDNYLVWKNGSRFWFWDEQRLIDMADPIGTTLGLINTTASGNAVAIVSKQRIYLFYPSGASTGNDKYIEWDMRFPVEYADRQVGPSPITGDGVVANALSLSTIRNPDGIVYGSKTTFLYAILGTNPTAGTKYTYAQAGAGEVALQLPDVMVGDGTKEAELEGFSLNMWADGVLLANNLYYKRRLSCTAQTEQTVVIPTTDGADAQFLFENAIPAGHWPYLGLSFRVALTTLASAGTARAIECMTLRFKNVRNRLRT